MEIEGQNITSHYEPPLPPRSRNPLDHTKLASDEHQPTIIRPFLHHAPRTTHPAPCTLHPAPCTLHPAPCTIALKSLFHLLCPNIRPVRVILWTPPPPVLPPNLRDALRRHGLIYAPLLIRYTPASLTSLVHICVFRRAHRFGVGPEHRRVC